MPRADKFEDTAPLTLDEAIKAIRSLEETYLMFHPGAAIPFVIMPAVEAK